MAFVIEHISASSEYEFVQRSAEGLAQAISSTIAQRGACTLGLSGGSTPRAVYEALGNVALDWERVTIFLVDERYVSPTDEQSNQRLVHETLLKGASAAQTVFPNTVLSIEQCIADYEQRLPQQIDIVVLGMGEDGHIASLFPGDIDVLLEQDRRVLQSTTEQFAVRERITVTMPVLQHSSHIFFLLKGENKKKMFAQVLSENTDVVEYPAHALLETGRTRWITWWP